MNVLLEELSAGVPDLPQVIRILLRLFMATLLGGILGFEREKTGKFAGLRTHMLVSLSSTVFVLAPIELGMSVADVSRVVQGVAAGIGFIGAGAILKLTADREIQGLTTAASIWMTAAVGLATGLGRYGLAVLAVAIAFVILAVLARLERPRSVISDQ